MSKVWAFFTVFIFSIWAGNAQADITRIDELEKAITPIWSPMILNGDGFGILSNYSLTMATYITRANAATLDLRDIMMRG